MSHKEDGGKAETLSETLEGADKLLSSSRLKNKFGFNFKKYNVIKTIENTPII